MNEQELISELIEALCVENTPVTRMMIEKSLERHRDLVFRELIKNLRLSNE